MEFHQNDLLEFAAIWKQEFGEEISLDEASVHAVRLIELYRTLQKPIPDDQPDS